MFPFNPPLSLLTGWKGIPSYCSSHTVKNRRIKVVTLFTNSQKEHTASRCRKQKVRYLDEQRYWAHTDPVRMCLKITEVNEILSTCLNIYLSIFACQSRQLNMGSLLGNHGMKLKAVSHMAENYCFWFNTSLHVHRSVRNINCNHILHLRSLYFLELEFSGHGWSLSSLFYLVPYHLNWGEWGMPHVQNVGAGCHFLK